MKRALAYGYFSGTNYGDNWIQACWVELLKEYEISFRMHAEPPNCKELRRADLVVIGGGGLVFERAGIWKNSRAWLAEYERPLLAAGLGINRMSPALKDDVMMIVERADAFWVRDQTSFDLLDRPAKVQMGPDLAWMSPRTISISGTGPIAVCLAPCPWKDFSAEAWRSALSPYTTMGLPLHAGGDRDRELLLRLGVEPSSGSLEDGLGDCEFLIASRYHALILAAQNGLPFLAVNYDHKVERLAHEWGLAHLLLETERPEELADKISWLRAHRAEVKEQLADIAAKQLQLAAALRASLQHGLAMRPERPRRTWNRRCAS